MLSLVILFLIISTLFLIEKRSINLLAYYIALVLIIAIIISIYPEYNTYGGYNQICDISYISYILILVQISALTIIFGFIIMLYPKNNTEIELKHSKSIVKPTNTKTNIYKLIFIILLIILGFILLNKSNINLIDGIVNILKTDKEEYLDIRRYKNTMGNLHELLSALRPRTYGNLITKEELYQILENQTIQNRFKFDLNLWYNWYIHMYIPLDIEKITFKPFKDICITLNHFIVEANVLNSLELVHITGHFMLYSFFLTSYFASILNKNMLSPSISPLLDLLDISPYYLNQFNDFSYYYTNLLSHISFLLYADPSNIFKFMAITILLLFAIICLFFILYPTYFKSSSSKTNH
jgi:hypothetical protein